MHINILYNYSLSLSLSLSLYIYISSPYTHPSLSLFSLSLSVSLSVYDIVLLFALYYFSCALLNLLSLSLSSLCIHCLPFSFSFSQRFF